MMKSLYAGVSGLRNHQTKMDVIGNNIANVNTNGYKTQRTTFRDVYYQTITSPSEGSDKVGGTNSFQIGYGSKIGSIDTINTISGYTPTDKITDLYISGEGYFAVQDSNGEKRYTRLGALSFDSSGNLVDVNGLMVFGANGTDTISDTAPETIKIENFENYNNISVSTDGTIMAYNTEDGEIQQIGQIAVAIIPNKDALVAEGNSYYSEGKNTGTITFKVPGEDCGSLVSGGLEMSNVDLAREFSDMIITQRGFQANSKIFSVADEMLQELVNLKR